jgi:hypothetical protein
LGGSWCADTIMVGRWICCGGPTKWPRTTRYAYVYAVALNSTGGAADALALLERTHLRRPAERDVLTALVLMEQDRGDFPKRSGTPWAGNPQSWGRTAPLTGLRSRKESGPVVSLQGTGKNSLPLFEKSSSSSNRSVRRASGRHELQSWTSGIGTERSGVTSRVKVSE